MTPDELRAAGAQAVEWVARYLEGVEAHPVLSQVEPGWVRNQLPEHPPDEPEPFEAVLADLDRIVLPAITHWQSPSFFGFFPGNASGPSILGDLVSSGLGVQGMLWVTSPACTELETHVLDWIVELCGLPDRFRSDGDGGGVIQDSASSATLCAIVAARHKAGDAAALPSLRAYTSTHAHSSVEKGIRIAGLDAAQLRAVDVDSTYSMRPDALAAAVAADRVEGLVPFLVVATSGTTSSTAFDPVDDIAAIAEREGMWLHVDAAYAGSAAVCPELRFVNAGLDRADSYCFDPHKWLLTNFDCDCFYVADRAALVRSLSVLPEYLRNTATESGAVIDYRDWHVPLGRRFRALKLWFVLRHYGAAGLRDHIRRHVSLARDLDGWVAADRRFELAAPTRLGLVCLRHVEGDDANQRVLDGVNASGEAYITATRLDGLLTLRVAIGQTATERRHVEALWELMRRFA